MNKERRQKLINSLLVPFLAILSGLLVAALLILFGHKPPLEAYQILFSSGFGCSQIDRCALFTTFQFATPLILTGLSAVVAFRSGMFSIGQEGQFIMGAAAAAWLGYAVHLPPFIHALFIILVGMLGGAIYGWIPGFLKVRLGVNEIISTIVMNNIAILSMEYLVNYPLRAPQSQTPYSPIIDGTAWLATFVPGSKWGVGFILAIAAAVGVYFLLWRSAPGYEIRMAGQAPWFSKYGGIKNENVAMRSMFISGAIAGLAGVIEVLGVHHRVMSGFSSGMGFDGLSVAILGQVHPVGVVIVGILFAGVRLGAQLGLQISMDIPRELGGGIIALMILFVAAGSFYQENITAVQKLIQRIRQRIHLRTDKPTGGRL